MNLVRFKLALSVLLITVLIAAPDTATGQPKARLVELHPTPDNIPEVTDPKFILHEGSESTFLNEDDYETITIGVAEGEYHEMFGDVADIASLGDGTLLVLDSEYSELRFYNYDGDLLGIFGGPGEGPGEFPNPPDYISVADQGKSVFTDGFHTYFIRAFERTGAATLAPKLKFQEDLIGDAGCAMNGSFWFLGYSPAEKGVLHKYNYQGERVASFLDHYESPREYISHRLSKRGSIACSEKHGIVALNRVNAPVITGYREDGSLAWQVKLADFDPLMHMETKSESGGSGWGWYMPNRGKGLIGALFTDSAGDFYVHYSVAEGQGWDTIPDHGPLFRIDALTGEGAYLGNTPPVREIDGSYVFSASNSPFPHVVIHKPKSSQN